MAAAARPAGAGVRRLLAALVLLAVLVPLPAVFLAEAMTGGVADPAVPLRNSVLVAAAASLVATALGTAAGIGLRAGFAGRGLAVALIALPLLLPPVVPGAALLLVAERSGHGAGRPGLVLWHALLAAPLVAALVRAALGRVDPALFRTVAACGVGPALAARRLLRPRLLPAVGCGAALALAVSIGESGLAVLRGAGTLPAAALPNGVAGEAAQRGAAALALLLAAGALALAFLFRPVPDTSGRNAWHS